MTTDDLIGILKNVTGDARGIEADDVLLARYRLEAQSEFWEVFHQALLALWESRNETGNDHLLAAAAAFIAQLRP